MDFSQIFSGIGIGFGVIGILSFLTFLLVAVGFCVIFSKMIATSRADKAAPRLRVQAKILAKRTRIASRSDSGHISNRCYVTFEVESGDRMELLIPWEQYGLLIEGDQGFLTFQGTRFISFVRG